MSFTSTSTFSAIFITATDIAYVAGDELIGVQDLSVSDSRAAIDVTALGDGYHFNLTGARTVELTFSGSTDAASAPQGVLRTAFAAGSVCYLHVITNPAATSGQVKGRKYPVYISTYSTSYAIDSQLKFDATAILAAAPSDLTVP